MAKKNITTHEENKIGSRAAKKSDHDKAVIALEKAKAIPRNTTFIKQGESDYSRKLKMAQDDENALTTLEAAEYLEISYRTFVIRQTKKQLPFIRRGGNKKFFRKTDLDVFQSKFTNA